MSEHLTVLLSLPNLLQYYCSYLRSLPIYPNHLPILPYLLPFTTKTIHAPYIQTNTPPPPPLQHPSIILPSITYHSILSVPHLLPTKYSPQIYLFTKYFIYYSQIYFHSSPSPTPLLFYNFVNPQIP